MVIDLVRGDSDVGGSPSGTSTVDVVTDRPDELDELAVGAGATTVQGPHDEDSARGPHGEGPRGNIWSFGTYRGQA